MSTETTFTEFVKRAQGTHSAIAADLAPFGGILKCRDCQRTQPLGDVAGNLREGWPRCCGHTMRWITQRQLDAGES